MSTTHRSRASDLMVNELNACPCCGTSPIRIVMPMGLEYARYECSEASCRYYAPPVAEEPAEIADVTEKPRTQWLWVTHHHDFG